MPEKDDDILLETTRNAFRFLFPDFAWSPKTQCIDPDCICRRGVGPQVAPPESPPRCDSNLASAVAAAEATRSEMGSEKAESEFSIRTSTAKSSPFIDSLTKAENQSAYTTPRGVFTPDDILEILALMSKADQEKIYRKLYQWGHRIH